MHHNQAENDALAQSRKHVDDPISVEELKELPLSTKVSVHGHTEEPAHQPSWDDLIRLALQMLSTQGSKFNLLCLSVVHTRDNANDQHCRLRLERSKRGRNLRWY